MTTKAAQAATATTTPEAPPLDVSREPSVHFLKSWPIHYRQARAGAKPFEVRRDDRTPRYQTGDVAVMQEFDPERNAHTGSGWQVFSVGYVERGACLPEGWCVFTLEKASAKQKRAASDAAMNGTGSK